jgi:ornithine cyclodeaminase/alanine dehydrogenase
MQTFKFSGRAPEVLLLSADDIRNLLTWADAVSAVEAAFHALGTGAAPTPGILGFHISGGGFHIKAGLSQLEGGYFVTKINANLPANSDRGLPTIQGVIALFSAVDGRVLALLDSSELTARRTGAATAVAAKYLSRSEANSLTLIGCGVQAYAQIRAVCEVRPIERVFTYDLKQDAAEVMAHRIEHDIDIEAEPVPLARAGTLLSDIIITCTSSRTPVLFLDDVRPGTFVAAVGADNPEKHEIDAPLLRKARVVADLVAQCQTIGDLHHADVSGAEELAAFVAGFAEKPASDDEIIVFDSTGIALQDVFAAAHVYEKALQPVHS